MVKQGAFLIALLGGGLATSCSAKSLYHVCIGSLTSARVECGAPMSKKAAQHRAKLFSIVGAGTMLTWIERAYPSEQPMIIQVPADTDSSSDVPSADRRFPKKDDTI